jgi:hypothetical protein
LRTTVQSDAADTDKGQLPDRKLVGGSLLLVESFGGVDERELT